MRQAKSSEGNKQVWLEGQLLAKLDELVAKDPSLVDRRVLLHRAAWEWIQQYEGKRPLRESPELD